MVNKPHYHYILGGSTRIERYANDHLKNHLSKTKPILKDINIGVERASEIVSSLSHFSRQTQSLDECCDINSIIKNCLTVTKNQWELHFKIIESLQKDLPNLIGNEGKLHQVFINIITNAFQAMEENGTLKIRTTQKNNSIHISFIDDGHGIKEEFLHKVTDPFFTTKDPGEGIGLGMSISYNIIKEHKGSITYRSTLNKGTSVEVLLPYKS